MDEDQQDQAQQQQAFTLTKEVALSADLALACWCPTMDLVAAVTADGQLHLHRMDWQLLWALSPAALVTALAWAPDGKALAAGHANGAVSLLDVESGEVLAERKAHYAAVVSLQWGEQQQPASSGGAAGQLLPPGHSVAPHERFKRLFVPPELAPPGMADPLPDPYALTLEAASAAAWPDEPRGLSLLAAADARGHVSLWLQGQVQVAEVSGAVLPLEEAAGEAEAGEGEEYKLLHVLSDSQLQQVLTVNRSASGAVVLVSRSLAALQEQQQPLTQCTALFAHLQSFLAAAVKCVDVCAQEWGSVQADFAKLFDRQLKQELADQGSRITVPQQELLLLLATGATTPPLQSFLAATLGEAGLRRVARGIDAAAGALHTAVLERLMPLAELILFLLGELRGCVTAAAEGRESGWMGLQVEQLQDLELQAAAALLRAEQLRRSVTAAACRYRAFFSWLLRVIRQLEGSDTQASDAGASDAALPLAQCQEVLAFLKGQFLHDVIGPELSGAELDAQGQARAEACFYQGVGADEAHQLLALLMPCCPRPGAGSSSGGGGSEQQLQQDGGQLPAQPPPAAAVAAAAAACRRPLAAQLRHLQALCEAAFELPAMALSPAISPVGQLQLLPPAPRAGDGNPAAAAAAAAVAVGPPLQQPAQAADARAYVACLVPHEAAAAAAAAAASSAYQQVPGAQLLLVARLPAAGAAAPEQQPCLAAEAVLLQLQPPPGWSAAAAALYKDQQLALLLRDASCSAVLSPGRAQHAAAGHAHGGAPSSSLQLVQFGSAPWAHVRAQQAGPGGNGSSVLEQCLAAGALVAASQLPCRSRLLAQGSAAQLAVSRARGLACLVTDMQHLLLLDLEDDEEGEDEDSGDEQEDAEHGSGDQMVE